MAYRYMPGMYQAARRVYMRNPRGFVRGVNTLGRSTLAAGALSMLPPRGRSAPYNGAITRSRSRALSAPPVRTQQFRRGSRRMFTNGEYVGKFKKLKSIKNENAVYGNRGVFQTWEIHGRVNDPNVVYISHQAVDGYEVIVTGVEALMRKLFEKAGYKISSTTETIFGKSLTDSEMYRVQLTTTNLKTGVETVQVNHPVPVSGTIQNIATVFLPAFLEYSAGFTNTGAGDTGVDQKNPTRLILLRQDANVTVAHLFQCELRLADEIMCIMGSSELKIQNRTAAASGSDDAEDVSNNPLTGRIYEFKAMPKIRNKGAFPLCSIPVDKGIQLVRGDSFPDQAWREPPLPQVFSNCKKSSKVLLNPGQIKTIKVSYKKHMNFLTFLQKIRLQYGTGVQFESSYSIFPIQIVALEDLINVNELEKINVAYEANKTLGVYMKSNNKRATVTDYKSLQWDNFL